MSDSIKQIRKLEFQWQTQDPFLFCVHHLDKFPKGNDHLGPDQALLSGRNIGQDFVVKDGWRMYHGSTVPGFPSHPHRGFETITIVLDGLVDHADSMGASGRFGYGDVQWMTAGAGVQHSEMFPLLNKEEGNTMELFQIWLNLPKKSKFVEPYFSMLWANQIPVVQQEGGSKIRVIAGSFGTASAPAPPPDSWAADLQNAVSIWAIDIQPNGKVVLPAASNDCHRALYVHKGNGVLIDGQKIDNMSGVDVDQSVELQVENGDANASVLVLQGMPINESVVQYGPFVMNSEAEIRATMQDYQRTQFGGWPWESADPTHGNENRRFAQHADGRVEHPDT
ncbi:MAG: pirin family protein [Cyclobacteriaceae bacterium]